MEEQGFPFHVLGLLYTPLLFVILFLNALRGSIAWWLTSYALFVICILIVGFIFSLIFVCCKGATVYLARHGTDNEDEDDVDSNYQKSEAEQESDGQMEGGQFEDVDPQQQIGEVDLEI